MGLLDSFDYDALLKKLLEGQAQPDSKAPFSQGLMAMGAQMLANSHRGFGNALGAGGLGYLEASNAERARQQRDPMQQINMANAVMGLREKAENQKAMADWQRQLSGGPQNMPMAPQSDFAPGDAQGPVTPPMQAPMMPQGAGMGSFQPGATTSPLAPQTNIPSLQIVNAGMNSPSAAVRSWAKNIWETNYKPQNLTVGAKLLQGGQVVAENPNLPQGMEPAPDGSVRVKPNFPQAAATIASAVKGAEAEAAAKVADQYAPPGSLARKDGGTDIGTPATLRLAAKWGIPVPMAQEVTTQFPQEQWDNAAAALKQVGGNGSGGAANFDPQTGAVQSVRPGNQSGTGYGTPSSAKAAQDMIPAKVAEAEALLPAAQKSAIATQLAQKDAAALDKAQEAAQSSSQGNDMLNMIRTRAAETSGVYGGMFAPGVMGVAAFFNGLGMEFDAARFANSQESKKYMDTLGLSLIKQFVGSQNISDADRVAVMSIMPRINDDPKAREQLMDTLQSINDRKIATFGRMDSYLRDNGNLKGFDYKFTKAEKQSGGADLKQDSMAIGKAQAAIKAGADPTAVRRRLREQGYSDKGLQ